MSELTEANDMHFYTKNEISVELSDADYFDHQHLNYLGASKFTEAFVARILTMD